ncbi:MAG TPA: hypothetical protein VFN38_01855 [Gemmatimonadaceae bacterium]|nr:hypothetical protein [Gemmatimonadaceae bacterium]
MRHFPYLTNTRMVSLVSQRRRIVARREFAVSGAGAQAFEHYLANLKDVPTQLFTDLAEEDFRLDTIPHVGARDRDAILQRKLTQIFRNTPYRHALLQGREPEGRRDDRVFYTAITNPELLRVWLEMLERLRVPLEGIHSAAMFSGVLLEELDLVFAHTLLVTFTPGDAMRQSYFRDREIKFSRITPIDLEEGQSLGTMIAEETTRTWQYLDSLRNFAPEDRLEVCILVHPNDRRVVEPELRNFAQLQYHVLDIEQVAQKLGLKPAPLDSTAEEVMVHLFLLRRAENHFAGEELRRHATLRRARIALTQVSLALVAASIAWAGWNLAPALKATEADLRVTQQVAALDRENNEILKSLPSFGVGGSTMRDAVSFYNGAIRGFPTLAGFVVPLSGVLREHPAVRVTQLAWLATDDAKATPRLARTLPREAPPVRSTAKAPEAPVAAVPDDAPNPPFAGGRYEVALIEGSLRVPANDFRGALAEVEKLAADIARVEGFHADVVEGPLDVSPTQQIQGRLTERGAATMETRFVLRVVRERQAPA